MTTDLRMFRRPNVDSYAVAIGFPSVVIWIITGKFDRRKLFVLLGSKTFVDTERFCPWMLPVNLIVTVHTFANVRINNLRRILYIQYDKLRFIEGLHLQLTNETGI